MLSNAFAGQAKKPTEAQLSAALGETKVLWSALLADLAEEHELRSCEWGSSSTKAGWSLRVKKADRTIVYLLPSLGCFTAAFALGDKAVKVARTSALPEPVIKLIRESKRYGEGTGVRIEVREVRDLAVVETLVSIKLQN